MCEILLRVQNKVPPTDERFPLFTQAGDVVEVQPGGHQWGRKQVNNPAYRAISLPLVSVEEMSLFLSPRQERPGFLWRRRHSRVELSQLPEDASALTIDDLMNLRRERPERPDPRVLGGDPRVLG
jgi:hypothetical protein